MTLDEHVDLLKDYLLKSLLKASTTFVFLKLPFLAWGPLGSLTELALKKLLTFLINETELAAFFVYTDFRTSAQGRTYYEAIRDFRAAEESGKENDKKRAETNLKNSFRELVRLSN